MAASEESVDGHVVGTSEDSYFARRASGRETFTRAKRPAVIMIAALALGIAAVASLGIGLQTWINPNGASSPANAFREYTGYNSGQATSRDANGFNAGYATLLELVIGILWLLAWTGCAIGIWKGVSWVRKVTVALAALTVLMYIQPVIHCETTMDRVLYLGMMGSAAVALVLLLIPNKAWFDWRRHGAVVKG